LGIWGCGKRLNGIRHTALRCDAVWRMFYREIRGFAFMSTGITGIGKELGFISMQQLVDFSDVGRICRYGMYVMNPARLGVNAIMDFHAKVSLVAFLGLMHVWIPFALAFLVELGALIRGASTIVPCLSVNLSAARYWLIVVNRTSVSLFF